MAEELRTVEAAIGAVRTREWGFTSDDRLKAGCAVGLTHEGRVKIERGLIRPEDVRREKKERAAAEAVAARVAAGGDARVKEEPCPALSDPLTEELTAQRTAALRVEVMRRPDLALAGVVHALALPVFYRHAWKADSAFDIKATSLGLSERIQDAEVCPALKAIETEHEGWGHRLPGKAGDLWEWLLAQHQDTVLDLLAFLAGQSLNAVKQRHERGMNDRFRHADQVARSAALDMTQWWSTDEAYLTRLNKAQIAVAVTEGAGDGSREVAAALAKLPKVEAVKRAAQALEGRGWLPEPLRTATAEPVAEADGEETTVEIIRDAESADPAPFQVAAE